MPDVIAPEEIRTGIHNQEPKKIDFTSTSIREVPSQNNYGSEVANWKKNVNRLIRRNIISSMDSLPTLTELKTKVREREGELGVNETVDSLVSEQINVDPNMAKAAGFLSHRLRDKFPFVRAVVLIGGSVHGGARIREITGTPDESDLDWALITDRDISEEETSKVTEYANNFKDEIAQISNFGDDFHLCITANPKQYKAIDLENPSQVIELFGGNSGPVPRHPNRGRHSTAKGIGAYRLAMLYLQPSFPDSVNEKNAEILLKGLRQLSAEDPEKWKAAVDGIMKAWKFSHKLKSKHFNTSGRPKDTSLLHRVVEQNSSRIMSSSLYSLLRSTGTRESEAI